MTDVQDNLSAKVAEKPGKRRAWLLSPVALLTTALMLLYLIVRLPAIMAMPIFGDEAIYLRWAQLAREGNWWASLADPKPPLHFWLLSWVIELTTDPLWGSRLLSVGVGLVSIPLGMGVCGELARLWRMRKQVSENPEHALFSFVRPPITGRSLGLVFGVLMIFCPFLAFYQRLATADAMFVMEMLGAVGLSLRWGRQVAAGQDTKLMTLGLGIVIGLAMMTRQGLSYVLWGLPITAMVINGIWCGQGNVASGRRMLRGWSLMIAMAIAAAIWLPYLTARIDTSAEEARGIGMELKRRVLYQSQFTEGESKMAIATRNAKLTFLHSWDQDRNKSTGADTGLTTQPGDSKSTSQDTPPPVPVSGWFWFYLTPGIYLLGMVGLIWMAVRREWAVLIFLLVWIAVMLGPVVALGNVIYSRYTLAGAIPLLVSGAYLLVELVEVAFTLRWPLGIAWTVVAAFFGGVLIMPIQELGRQQNNWTQQTLTARDRYQYVTGWPAGKAAMRAVNFLKEEVSKGPVVVITDDGWGTPSDAMWAYLRSERNIKLYYVTGAEEHGILRQADATGTRFLLKGDKWSYTPEVAVAIGPEERIWFVTREEGASRLEENLRRRTPSLMAKKVFFGVGNEANPDRVLLFQVR